jgi:DNA-binding NtrC family response regulator
MLHIRDSGPSILFRKGGEVMAHIMVLEDDLDACHLIARILTGMGHEVHAFTDEQAALDHARHHSLDLAVLDIKLKKRTGLEVLEEMNQMNPGISAIMLTAYPALAKEAVKLGAKDFLVKPIDVDELEDRIRQVLGSSASA